MNTSVDKYGNLLNEQGNIIFVDTNSPVKDGRQSKFDNPFLDDNEVLKTPPTTKVVSASKEEFGGPIYDVATNTWIKTHEVVVVIENLPPDLSMLNKNVEILNVCKSAGKLFNKGQFGGTQSGFWVSPIHFISTLHLYPKTNTGEARKCTNDDLELIKTESTKDDTLRVSSMHIAFKDYSSDPAVKLLCWNLKTDLGVFEAKDVTFKAQHFVPVNMLFDTYNTGGIDVTNLRVAVISYNAENRNSEREKNILQSYVQYLSPPNVDMVKSSFDFISIFKPCHRVFSYGRIKGFVAGCDPKSDMQVALPLWYGSSGGVCVVIEPNHPLFGKVIGMVQGGQTAGIWNLVRRLPSTTLSLLTQIVVDRMNQVTHVHN